MAVGEFDLSFPSIYALSGSTVAALVVLHGWSFPAAAAGGDRLWRCSSARSTPCSWSAPASTRSSSPSGSAASPLGLGGWISQETSVSGLDFALSNIALARVARAADDLLVRRGAGRRVRLRDERDAARPAHPVRRRQPGGRPPGRHPRHLRPRGRLAHLGAALRRRRRGHGSRTGWLQRHLRRASTSSPPSPASSSAPSRWSRAGSTRSGCSSPSTSSSPASSASSSWATRDGSPTSSTARVLVAAVAASALRPTTHPRLRPALSGTHRPAHPPKRSTPCPAT